MHPTQGGGEVADHRRLAQDFADWLLGDYIDPHDFGYRRAGRNDVFRVKSRQLARFRDGVVDLRPLTVDRLAAHLRGRDENKLYYTSACGSGYAFPMIDVDAHKGQDDAPQAAEFIASNFFPGAYVEPSRRGVHIHPVIWVGEMPGPEFNELLSRLQSDLRALLRHNGFNSTLDLTGGFTNWALLPKPGSRHQTGAIPRLPNGFADLHDLRCAPVFLLAALDHVHQQALPHFPAPSPSVGNTSTHPSPLDVCVLRTRRPPFPVVYVTSTPPPPLEVCVLRPLQTVGENGRTMPRRDSASAWERMQWACWDFTAIHRRLPDVEELLDYYERAYQAGPCHPDRRRRARDAIRYRGMTFDPAKATEHGYEFYKDMLLDAVRTFCIGRTHRCPTAITDEDLAIGLYVVMRNSFADRRNPRLQWTNPYGCFQGMGKALKKAGLTGRGFGYRNKITAVIGVLERAKLIDCEDEGYVVGRGRGIGKKYTVGPAHWRHSEFVQFRQGVSVHHIGSRTFFPRATPCESAPRRAG